MKRIKPQGAARARRPTATTRPCVTVGAEANAHASVKSASISATSRSVLQAHAGEHRCRLIRSTAEVRLQPVLPHFGFEPNVAVELVDHPDRREVAIVEAPFADIV